MRAFLVSDNHDSLVGMRIAGIDGVLVRSGDETRRVVRELIEKDRDLGILVFTEKAAAAVPDLMKQLREHGGLPLIVEIPDRHGFDRGADFLTRYVKDAIGVRME
ncbi:V-type ATP synthase subunit F [Aminiphilus circumscriptus]|jgi:V/A-type H+-transporting ATPase subunit F|uniref:V-type ATP synthase subunit F n=1 Tax=Aminiphilus circumscriptus TaxID=290732 RepID=UPI000492A5E3|nr:V-type ATP synthase subunit F [Aminiphilus circumscriptus]